MKDILKLTRITDIFQRTPQCRILDISWSETFITLKKFGRAVHKLKVGLWKQRFVTNSKTCLTLINLFWDLLSACFLYIPLWVNPPTNSFLLFYLCSGHCLLFSLLLHTLHKNQNRVKSTSSLAMKHFHGRTLKVLL